mmetsp:Transcript_121825/g.272014  ORF Transcript_121825/g.272014 Transcript_121825/m.272014 type:complete len:149 (+) Transcript_121825:74-520(+)
MASNVMPCQVTPDEAAGATAPASEAPAKGFVERYSQFVAVRPATTCVLVLVIMILVCMAPFALFGDVGSDPFYMFDLQQIKMFPAGQERHLEPGDSVRVICSYRSTSRVAGTSSGWGSEDEMCMTALYAYPSENVETNNCFSDSSFEV